MHRLAWLLLAVLLLTVPASVPSAEAAGETCDCAAGFGACQHWLRAPWGVTADPCFCDRCRGGAEHDGNTVPKGMDAQCFTSARSDCYLKRHAMAWHLACSECMQKDKCCPMSHPENCPACETTASPLAFDDMHKPAKEAVLARLAKESKLFKKPEDVIVLYNAHFYVVTDISGIKVKLRSGTPRIFTGHEYAHLVLERAEMARKEFIQAFGDQIKATRPIGIFLPSKERDANTIQAAYCGSALTSQFYGGGSKTGVADGMCINGFCASEQKFVNDDLLHVRERHLIGQALISVWVVIEGQNRALPRWLFEGVGHWLSRCQDRFKDMAVFCSDEDKPPSASGKDWPKDCLRMALDPKLDPIEKLMAKTSVDQLSIDDLKRSWSLLDLCLREWKKPFVAMCEDLRREKPLRDAFMARMGVTPEILDERWKERFTGKRKSIGPEEADATVSADDTPGARERRGLKDDSDLAALGARIRALGTVDDPKTADALLDLIAKKSELVRDTAMVVLLKMQKPECLARIVERGLAHSDGIVRAYSARLCGKRQLAAGKPALRAMAAGDSNWLARAEAAIASGELHDVEAMAVMRKMVVSDTSQKAQLAAMDGLALFGEDGKAAVPMISKHLSASQWQLRVAACQALGRIGSMEAVEALIARYEQESGRVADEIHDALKAISYDDLGRSPANWRKWWENEKAMSPGGLPKRPAKPKEEKKPVDDRYGEAPKYYGIEIHSSRVGFVLDTSKSMEQLFDPDPASAAELRRTYTGATKLAICKEEIAQTMKQLDPRSHFAVIAFESRVRRFEKMPVMSSSGNVQSAIDWLKAIQPEGDTNSFGGLRASLDLDDDSADDSPDFRSTPDTISFLTDGMPTVGEITDADTLVEWYTALNRYARIRTNVVCLGTRGVDLVMLRALAERNAGKFVCVREK